MYAMNLRAMIISGLLATAVIPAASNTNAVADPGKNKATSWLKRLGWKKSASAKTEKDQPKPQAKQKRSGHRNRSLSYRFRARSLEYFHQLLNLEGENWDDSPEYDTLRIARDRRVAALMAEVGYYDYALRVLQSALILARVNNDPQTPLVRAQLKHLLAKNSKQLDHLPLLEPDFVKLAEAKANQPKVDPQVKSAELQTSKAKQTKPTALKENRTTEKAKPNRKPKTAAGPRIVRFRTFTKPIFTLPPANPKPRNENQDGQSAQKEKQSTKKRPLTGFKLLSAKWLKRNQPEEKKEQPKKEASERKPKKAEAQTTEVKQAGFTSHCKSGKCSLGPQPKKQPNSHATLIVGNVPPTLCLT